LFFLPLWFN